MCIKGLANVNHKPSETTRLCFVEILTPYLLNEEVSLALGPTASSPEMRPDLQTLEYSITALHSRGGRRTSAHVCNSAYYVCACAVRACFFFLRSRQSWDTYPNPGDFLFSLAPSQGWHV